MRVMLMRLPILLCAVLIVLSRFEERDRVMAGINTANGTSIRASVLSFFSYAGKWWTFNVKPVAGQYNNVLAHNANLSGDVGAGGSYGDLSHYRQGGDYVNNNIPRFAGKSLSFRVSLGVHCDPAGTEKLVRSFVQGLVAGCLSVRMRYDWEAFDLRLADTADVSYNSRGDIAVVAFTLVSSYPFLLDGRLSYANAGVRADVDEYFLPLSTTLSATQFAGIPVVLGTTVSNTTTISLYKTAKYPLGTSEQQYFIGTPHSAYSVTSNNFILGGNLGIIGCRSSDGILNSPVLLQKSLGYPLNLGGDRVRFGNSVIYSYAGIGRVLL